MDFAWNATLDEGRGQLGWLHPNKSVDNRLMIDVCLSAWSFAVQAQNASQLRRRGAGVDVGGRPRCSQLSSPLGLGLAGCGGGSPNASSNPASLAISGCSPSGCSSPGASASAEAMAVKFSVCMRSHGVSDFPDPTVGSNGLPSFGPTRNVQRRGAGVQRGSTGLQAGPARASRRTRPPKRRRPIARRSSTPPACGQTACPTFLIPTAKD